MLAQFGRWERALGAIDTLLAGIPMDVFEPSAVHRRRSLWRMKAEVYRLAGQSAEEEAVASTRDGRATARSRDGSQIDRSITATTI